MTSECAADVPSSALTDLMSDKGNAMTLRLGYLLPTREAVMAGQPEARPLLELAEHAERLGLD